MDDIYGGIGLGMIVGGLFVIIMFNASIYGVARDELIQCEATLPRNQNCTLIAVPEETP